MPQITLVPWTTDYPEEFGSAWTIAGVGAAALRAVSDGNHASSAILGGFPDSNPLRGRQWRVEGSGAVFSWANKVINSVLVQVNLNNNGPEGSSQFAFVSANESLSYAEQPFNGDIATPVNVPTWVSMINGAHPQVIAAILADNYLVSLHHYNHVYAGHTLTAEAARVVVTYTDNIPRAVLAMEG